MFPKYKHQRRESCVSAGVVLYFFMPLFFWCVSSYRSVVQYNSLIFFYCCFVELSFKLSSGSSPRPESPKDPGKQKKHTKTIHPGYSYSLFFVLSVFSKVLRCQGYSFKTRNIKHQNTLQKNKNNPTRKMLVFFCSRFLRLFFEHPLPNRKAEKTSRKTKTSCTDYPAYPDRIVCFFPVFVCFLFSSNFWRFGPGAWKLDETHRLQWKKM